MNYRDVRPLIATPCYGGLIHEGYMRGLTSFVAAAVDLGMESEADAIAFGYRYLGLNPDGTPLPVVEEPQPEE